MNHIISFLILYTCLKVGMKNAIYNSLDELSFGFIMVRVNLVTKKKRVNLKAQRTLT